ncbi:MAG: flagellar hook-length control protein FliK [Lachnospiraceae bacterium]|nr:flagellar hook-length control protein FliK [Lachnospiraceae bacterium]
MSMLSSIFGAGSTAPVQNIQNGGDTQATADARGAEYLSRLSGGQTVEGKVTDVRGNDVQIELPGGGTVTARMENAVDLNPGQIVSFEVRSNTASGISLTPLYTNLNMDPTAVKALTAADMEVTARTLSMATTMMENGMSIDSRSLGDMYHLIHSLPDADAEQLVEMKRLGLPVNEESVEQYAAFKNYENQISEGMARISEGAIALYEELAAADGGEGKAIHFMRQLTELFSSGRTVQEAAEEGGPATEGKVILSEDGSVRPAPTEDTIKQAETQAAKPGAEQAAKAEDPAGRLAAELENLLKDAAEGKAGKEGDKVNAEDRLRTLISLKGELPETADNTKTQIHEDTAGSPAAERLGRQFRTILSELPGGAVLAEQIRNLPDTDMLKLAHAAAKLLDDNGGSLPDKKLEAELKELLRSEDFKSVVKEAMKDSWSLKPEQVADKANVDQLYQRLGSQMKELTQDLARLAEPGSPFAQSLSDMGNNLDFMNQMNQAMQYVQIPLRMNGGEATGDLYVYSNKKSLANKDGSVSAMLHLSMENLGTVDVYAAISSGNNVSTRFYLESDEVIDFIAEHIHILNERLEKRGYNVKADIRSREDMKDEGKIRSLTPPAGGKLIAKQSFDMRA